MSRGVSLTAAIISLLTLTGGALSGQVVTIILLSPEKLLLAMMILCLTIVYPVSAAIILLRITQE